MQATEDQASCCSPCHSEVWVLVYCTGNEAAYVSPTGKHVRKRSGEGRGCLHSRESYFAYVAFHGETKAASHLVHCNCSALQNIERAC